MTYEYEDFDFEGPHKYMISHDFRARDIFLS
jgi:hypothetical protein